MNEDAQKKRTTMMLVVAGALLLPVALAVAGGWAMWMARPPAPGEPSPEQVEQLRAAVERAAETALPVPRFLSSDAIVIECPEDGFEKEVQRVVRLATGLGGSASSYNDGATVRIVATVPEGNAAVFRDALQRGVYDIAAAGGGKPTTIVEVLLKPVGEAGEAKAGKP